MSANVNFRKHLRVSSRFTVLGMIKSICMTAALLLVALPAPAGADDLDDVEKAVIKLAEPQEKAGFDFRADIWSRELKPDLGKAVRSQLFKGNEYRVCVAVPQRSGVEIAAHVLDAQGKPVESAVETVKGGWGVTLHVLPQKTGVYMVVIRRSGGKEKAALVGMISGYK
jgi:hypothetical protein